MAENDIADAKWIAVIARGIAYLCLKEAEKNGSFKGVLDRVDFMESLGLPLADAAKAVGSSKASVDELRRVARVKKSGGKNGKSKSKSKSKRK